MSNTKNGQSDARERSRRRESADKKKRRQKKKNQRRLAIALIIIALALVLVLIIRALLSRGGIGFSEAEETTLTLTEDGEVIYEEIIAISDESLTESDISDYIKEELRVYNEAHGDRSITLNKVRIEDGTAYQRTTYKDATCYSDFTDFELYSGTVRDAVSAGYDFATNFVSVYEGMVGDEITSDMALTDTSLSALIIRENGLVRVPGSIRFISSNGVRLRGADLAEVYPVDGASDAAVLAYIIYE